MMVVDGGRGASVGKAGPARGPGRMGVEGDEDEEDEQGGGDGDDDDDD